ncbi:MAG TPA: glutaminyl-peptide cyclotransferase [Lacibacter sp.]|nr:glutaminyl-peptide cyclotransferase [Lacibacter sp.]HMO89020.1 glutaminyl-peptide cyclotransferase [Lacibacter sp.]HMP86420.1 glutaminyl-peptide cyclotransferase [Lacibacter sp.]
MTFSRIFPLVVLLAACTNNDASEPDNGLVNIPAPAPLSYTLIRTYPHDTASFTQGLVFHNGVLYESTGNPDNIANNGSWLGPVNIENGMRIPKATLPAAEFGEGMTILNGKVYQLTWQNKKGYVYDLATFKKTGEFTYNHDGWGITNDGIHLIVSDGSSNIYFWDPATFKEVKRLSIRDNRGLKNNLNELEFIRGSLYANVWQTSQVYRIDTASGYVTGVLDLSDLLRAYPELQRPPADVPNGIAWDSSGQRLFLTGKKWPLLFEVQLP